MPDFRDSLRTEIIASQEERAAFVRQKFTYVIATFGAGSISSPSIPTSNLIFLAPIVAFTFDLYISGVDFGIKRAGAFLGAPGIETPPEEAHWQAWVTRRRDPFSKLAGPFLSGVVLLGSLYMIASGSAKAAQIPGVPSWLLLVAWSLVNCVLIAGVWFYSHRMNHLVGSLRADERDELDVPGAVTDESVAM